MNITHICPDYYIHTLTTNKDAIIVTYYRKGGRGALAAEVLRKMGYKNAPTLKGWAKAGYAIQTGLGETSLNKGNR